ncbi:MAG: flagellar biosynthesis regulator FlaF [Rhodomicrobium sp.]
MYRSSYAEVLENAPQNVRHVERGAILHSIRLLDKAERAGVNSREGVEALYYTRRLWEFFLAKLAETEHPMAEKLRAELISVGIGLLKEVEAVRTGKAKSFQDLKEISQIIADGLS